MNALPPRAWLCVLIYFLCSSLVEHGSHRHDFAEGGVVGLTKFLRTRKPYGDSPSSWWLAKPGPSTSASAKDSYERSGSGTLSRNGEVGGGGKNSKKRGPRGVAPGSVVTDSEEEDDDSIDVLYENKLTDEGSQQGGLLVGGTNSTDSTDSSAVRGTDDSTTGRSTSRSKGGKGLPADTVDGPQNTPDIPSKSGRQGALLKSAHNTPAAPYRADHVCVDMNQILHGSFRTSSDPRHCIAKIFVGERARTAVIATQVYYRCHCHPHSLATFPSPSPITVNPTHLPTTVTPTQSPTTVTPPHLPLSPPPHLPRSHTPHPPPTYHCHPPPPPSHTAVTPHSGLDKILRLVEPIKSLVLTFDGPAPFAKLQTQRNRRISNPENSLITPGTDFMNAMDDVITCYVLQVVAV